MGQDTIVERLRSHVESYHKGDASLPNLLFVGPPGIGKTTAAQCLARELYGDGWKGFVLQLDASSDRGIDVIRGRVKDFAKSTSLGEHFNIIILDEADQLTSDAQAALRRTMEDYSRSCRFILIANFPNKIIAPVIDRCSTYRFEPIATAKGTDALARVCDRESIDYTFDGLRVLWESCDGSLRRALNQIPSVQPPITPENIPIAHADDGATDAITLVVKGDVREAEKVLLQTIRRGVTPDELFLDIFTIIDASNLPDATKNIILKDLGEYEYRVATGCNFELQARCFLRHLAARRGK